MFSKLREPSTTIAGLRLDGLRCVFVPDAQTKTCSMRTKGFLVINKKSQDKARAARLAVSVSPAGDMSAPLLWLPLTELSRTVSGSDSGSEKSTSVNIWTVEGMASVTHGGIAIRRYALYLNEVWCNKHGDEEQPGQQSTTKV